MGPKTKTREQLSLTPSREGILIPELKSVNGQVRVLIINGDGREARHKSNVSKAIGAFISRGIRPSNIFVAGKSRGKLNSEVHQFEGTTKGVSQAISAIRGLDGRPLLSSDDVLWVYVTGHGARDGFALEDKNLTHGSFVRQLKYFSKNKVVAVFDCCYSGVVPNLLADSGLNVAAMSPGVEGKETVCHFFANAFWDSIKYGIDMNGDNVSTLEEVFRYSVEVYRNKMLDNPRGSFRRTIAELSNLSQMQSGNVLIELKTPWCAPCKKMAPVLNSFSILTGGAVAVYTIDGEKNPLAGHMKKVLGKSAFGYPTFVFLKDGKLKHVSSGFTGVPELLVLSKTSFGVNLDREKIIMQLKRDLQSNNLEKAIPAFKQLAYLASPDDYDELIELAQPLIRHTSAEVRVAAVQSLAWVVSSKSLATLTGLLSDPDHKVKTEVIKALGTLGNLDTIQPLTPFLTHPEYRSVVMASLLEIIDGYDNLESNPKVLGVVPLVLPMLKVPAIRLSAIKLLTLIRSSASIHDLVQVFSDKNWKDCHKVASAYLTPANDFTASILTGLLDSGIPKMQDFARLELVARGDLRVVKTLIKFLSDKNPDSRYSAVSDLELLAKRNPLSPEIILAVPHLLRLLHDPELHVCRQAARSLGETKDPRAVPPLIKIAKNKSHLVWVDATLALGHIGDKTALPVLSLFLRDPDKFVRAHSIISLCLIGDVSFFPQLLELLENKDYSSSAVAEAIGILALKNPKFSEVTKSVPRLISLLKDKYAVSSAVIALGQISEMHPNFDNKPQAVRALARLATNGDRLVRSDAINSLAKMGSLAVPYLNRIYLNENDLIIQAHLLTAFRKLGLKPPGKVTPH